ncbi:hypothetical protein ABID21_001406 [Pseudorhizobium tarimense]|uniref:Uncharacterized protein n=1 Tax=Pseudorhizobium tarimense TaxID=1079109 RepID=A0ABV2H478_9HYPH
MQRKIGREISFQETNAVEVGAKRKAKFRRQARISPYHQDGSYAFFHTSNTLRHSGGRDSQSECGPFKGAFPEDSGYGCKSGVIQHE